MGIGIIALVATSPFAYRVRRIRPVMMLASGGWFAVAIGMLIGRTGSDVIEDQTVLSLTPLATLGLGWIGLLVGIQIRSEVLKRVTVRTHCLGLIDVFSSSVVFGLIGLIGIWLWTDHIAIGALAALAFGSIGWSVESRSLGLRDTRSDQSLAMMIRAVGGIGGTVSVAAFGVVTAFMAREPDGEIAVDLLTGALRVTVCVLLALVMGLLGRLGLHYAGRSAGEQLVVFLGVVAFAAGTASQFGVSPLLGGLLCGIVIANLPGSSLRSFERFILRAEQVVATLAWIFAGIILDLSLGLWGVMLGVAIGLTRLLAKPMIFGTAISRDPELCNSTARMRMAVMRQSPLALIMGVGLYLDEPSTFHAQVIGVLVVSGLIGSLGPMLQQRKGSQENTSGRWTPDGATA